MTRYARAKGSKASNERVPNEATPWHLMKLQLEESKNKKVVENKKSAKELLKDRQDSDEIRTSNHDWAEFDNNKSENLKPKRYTKLTENSKTDDATYNVITKSDNMEGIEKTKDGKIERMGNKKNKFSNKKCNINNSESNNKESSTLQSNKSSNSSILSKRQKRNLKRKLENSQSKVKEKRIKNNTEYKRRKLDTGIQTIIINGMVTEIVKYDGFPVKKEDAERLAKLKQELLMKGKYTNSL